MKRIILFCFLIINSATLLAQTKANVKGKVMEAKTLKMLSQVSISLDNTEIKTTTNSKGEFELKELPVGLQIINISFDGYKDQTISVKLEANKTLNLGALIMEEDEVSEERLSVITITDNDLADDNGNSETTSGMLQSSRDAFQQAAAFNWGQSRFRMRGMNSDHGAILINGISMNKIFDGRPQFSNWGGLNDVTRNQEFTLGSAISDYSFGGVLGVQAINTRASIYRPGSRVSFSGSNTTYNYRTMMTHSSGMNKYGWGFTLSASRRWGSQGYFEGVNNSSNALFASIEKRINSRHSLNLTGMYSQNTRGRNSSNTQEVTDLTSTRYNAFWGWQDGVKRNSRMRDVNEPIFILSHYWKLSDRASINTNVSYQLGQIGNTRIGYQGVDNPDPTYYRSLPNYYYSLYDGNDYVGNSPENIANANNVRNLFLNNQQVNWSQLTTANRNSDGGNSLYYLYEDRNDDRVFTANTLFNTQATDNIAISGGVTYKRLSSHNFQNMLDLLGGQYFNDIDNYGRGIQQQPDLNNQNRIVGVGDSFRYNYYLYANTIDMFLQYKFTYKKIDFYLAQNYSRAEYQREGIYKNGYYPANSFGLSNKSSFENFGFKGGLTYKITGKHLLTLNALYMTKAPTLRNVYANARVNSNETKDVTNERVSSADVSYIFRSPTLKMRITAFYSKIQNATDAAFFFADGVSIDDGDPSTEDAPSNFVSQTLSKIDKRNVGLEFGLEYQITSTVKATVAGAYGEYIYDSNPQVRVNIDSRASATSTYPVYDFGNANMKGYKIGGMPQTAATVGLEYRDPHFWWVSTTANYLGNNYLEVAPILRTQNFFLDNTSGTGVPFTYTDPTGGTKTLQQRAAELLEQEKFAAAYLFNVNAGYSIKLGKQTLGFFASVNNLFDFKYKSGGFEQARNGNFQQVNQDFTPHNINGVIAQTPAFGPKYFYGFGRTYFFNVYLNF
ncbi:MAG: TonB-dependent receptor [Flavobacterium sp. BFFFF2]|nr:MAG: TonB-dependent receptor [Flavobacterium sp. BFFFF2]